MLYWLHRSLITQMTAASIIDTPLRIATLNVGLGLQHKLQPILQRCMDLTIDIAALQEIGDPAIIPSSLTTHSLVFSPGPSHHQAGVGILISRDLIPHVEHTNDRHRVDSSASCSSYLAVNDCLSSLHTCRLGSITHLVYRHHPHRLDHCMRSCWIGRPACSKSS